LIKAGNADHAYLLSLMATKHESLADLVRPTMPHHHVGSKSTFCEKLPVVFQRRIEIPDSSFVITS
jgi:hypothetical protein